MEQILVSAHGRGVFTTDQDGDLYIWDAAGGKSPRRIAGGIERGVVASPDGRFLAWAVEIDSRTPDPSGRKWYQIASRVRLYDVASQQVIDRLPGFEDHAAVAAFLPDGKTLLTLGGGFGDATVRLWDVASGKELRSFAVVGQSRMRTLAPPWSACPSIRPGGPLSPDGKMLAIGPDWEENLRTVDRDVPVSLWDVATGKAGPELNKPTNVSSVPDEAGLGKDDYTPQVPVNRKMKSAHGRAFSPDGRFLVDWAENPFGAAGWTTWSSGTRRRAERSRPSLPACGPGRRTRRSHRRAYPGHRLGGRHCPALGGGDVDGPRRVPRTPGPSHCRGVWPGRPVVHGRTRHRRPRVGRPAATGHGQSSLG